MGLTSEGRRIALRYLGVVTALFLIGGLLGTFLRLELLTSQEDFLGAGIYGRLFSMHGIIMVFFVAIPAIPAVLGSLLLPQKIGSRGMAFPRLSLASWVLFSLGALLVLISLLGGGVGTGWTMYPSPGGTIVGSNLILIAVGVILASSGMILLGINFISTVHRMREKQLTWFKLPLLVWSFYTTAWIILIAAPVLVLCMALLAADEWLGFGIFKPAMGGDPALFQKLFWFFGRPALSIMVLPAIGVVSELLKRHTRREVYGYHGCVFSILAVALMGFLTTGSHIFVSSQSSTAALVASFISFLSAVPFAVILFSWVMTLYRGAVTYAASMLYVLGFIGLVTIGGLGGLFLSAAGISVHLHSTYFVVAHFHYLLAGAVLMAYLGGLHFWWNEISGRALPEILGKASAVVIFCGVNLTFLPQFILGFAGLPRRYAAYPVEFELLQALATAGIPLLAIGYLGPMLYFGWSLRWGRPLADP
jgi:cytochrome c oxidase subunit 1